MKVTLCASCALGQGGFEPVLAAAMAAAGVALETGSVDCLSGCRRPSAVAFRAPGKTAYLFGDLGEADRDDLVRFAQAYALSPDGNFTDARVLGGLRFKALARIPG